MAEVFLLRIKNGKIPKDHFSHLLKKTGWVRSLEPQMLVALKMHFGEKGNRGQISPEYIAAIVKDLKSWNTKPFLTETSTLYVGQRSNAYDHMLLAFDHGYGFDAVGAPIIMADGLRGHAQTRVPINGKHFKKIEVASDARVYDALAVLTHVTGHMEAGIGGTLKNLAMGLSARGGKLAQHSVLKPQVDSKGCTACGHCAEWCPTRAIALENRKEKARINPELCIGCGECLAVCPEHAVGFSWDEDCISFQERMAEHALGVVSGREKTSVYLNFLTSVTRNCDCIGNDNQTYFSDIGVIASRDPVAVDQAAADLICQQYGKDFFRESFPSVDYSVQLVHAENIGLGHRQYTLEEI